MTLNLTIQPPMQTDFTPRITVIGVGGGGTNAVDNMIAMNLQGVDFVVANTDAQQLMHSRADRRIQLGPNITQGLGAGAKPEIGRAAAEEAAEELYRHLDGVHMLFITAGMGGGTGTGAAPVIARMARERNILTVGVVTKPFTFEGSRRARAADDGLADLQQWVDTLIVIPNQNLFRLANERTGWKEAFKMADQVLYMGVKGVTDLMVAPGLVNLDFADIKTVMAEMGKAMMGTGEADGENRAIRAAELAISNPLLEDTSMRGARGLLINITGGEDMTLYEVDAAANRIREEVADDANIIFGSAVDDALTGRVRVSVVATGIEAVARPAARPRLVTTDGDTTSAPLAAEPVRSAGAAQAGPPAAVQMAGQFAGAAMPISVGNTALAAQGTLLHGAAPMPEPAILATQPVRPPPPVLSSGAAGPAPRVPPRNLGTAAPFLEPPPLQPLPPRGSDAFAAEPLRPSSNLRTEAGTAAPRAPAARAPAPSQDARTQAAALGFPQGSTSAGTPPQPTGGGTLFTRMTGLFRQRGGAPMEPRQSEARHAVPQAAAVHHADPGAELLPQSGASGSERIDLEIPTFLRRQHPGNNVH